MNIIPLPAAFKAARSGPLRSAWYTALRILLLAFLLPVGAFAQGFYLPPGSSLTVGNGSIDIPGTLYISTGATVIVSTGTIILGGDLNQNGSFIPGTGTLVVDGTIGQSAGTTSALYSFVMNAPGGMRVNADMEINGSFSLLAGKIYIGNAHIILGDSAIITEPQPGSYVVTDSMGTFSALVGSTQFSFPIGTDGAPAPLGVRNSGADERLDVRVQSQSEPGTVFPVEWWIDGRTATNDLRLVVDYSAFGATPNINHELLMRSSTNDGYVVVGKAVAVEGTSVVFAVPYGSTLNGSFFAIGVETLPKQVTIATILPGYTVQSGETLTISVALRLSDNSPAIATMNTIVHLNIADPALIVVTGTTQSIVIPTGLSSTTLTLSLVNVSAADVTSAVTVQADNIALLPGTVSLVVHNVVPPSFAARAGTGAVFLTWQTPAAQNVQKYRLYRGTHPDSLVFIREIPFPATAVDDSTVQNGTRYYYALTSVLGGQESARTSVVSTVPTLLTVVAPNGGEVWQVGLTKAVQWTTVGVVDTVRIDYSADNGATWSTIATVPDTGSYLWLVYDVPSPQARIRVMAAANDAISDFSNAVFTVEAIAPPQQVAVVAGMGRTFLSWQPSVSEEVIGYVVYRGETSGTLSPIATLDSLAVSLADSGLVDGTRYYYAIKTMVNRFFSPFSAEVSAVPSSFVLSSPVGGDQWQAGLSKTISWTTIGEVDSILVEYSTDAGVHWFTIATVLNTGSYDWTVPNTPSGSTMLRISDANNPNIVETTDSAFTVIELLPPGNAYATSTSAGIVVSWDESASDGVDMYQIYEGTSPDSLTLLTTVNAPITSYLHAPLTDGVRHYYEVRSVARGQISRPSDQVSSISTFLQVYSPNGGEQFQAGRQYMTTWGISGNISRMAFEYSEDNGATWIPVSQTVIQGGLKSQLTYYFEWTVPNTPTTTALVRVSSLDAPAASDQSDAVFTILPVLPPQNVVAVANNGGINLTWSASASAPVSAYNVYRGLSPNSISSTPIASVDGSTLTWRDESVSLCQPYYYAVKSAIGLAVSGNSAVTSATVLITANVDVQSPAGGETWQAGTPHMITWTSTACTLPSQAMLSYSTDGSSTWTAIATVPNTGSYLWTVANQMTTQAVVRVEMEGAADNSGVFAISTIPPASNLVATAGDGSVDLSWTASSAQGLTGYEIWRATGSSSAALLATTSNVSVSYTDASVTNCTEYTYTVVAKVGSMSSAPTAEASATPFITPAVVVNAPTAGTTWQAGTAHLITWTSTSCTVPSQATLSYSVNGGTTWTTIATVSNTGSYSWTVVDQQTAQAVVRVQVGSVSSNSGVFAISTIPPASNLVATAGDGSVGLSWTASPAQGLTGYEIWRAIGSSSAVLLATTSNVSVSYTDASVSNCTAYRYTVVAKVGALSSAPTAEASATPFITPAVAVSAPVGGETWQAGTAHMITWTSTSCTVPSQATLSYSTNGGTTWTTIGTVSNTGSYLWTVANQPTAQAVVRVQVGSVSSNSGVFTINAIPAASNLVATAGDGSVGLSWTASSAQGLTGYEIWRATGSSSAALLATTSNVSVSYTDASVTNCTAYRYTVVAKVGSMSSAPTAEASATPFITPAVVINAPTAGTTWQAGTAHLITWTSTSCTLPSQATLSYSTNAGTTWTAIGTVSNTGSYSWTVVNQPTTQAVIRVQVGSVVSNSGTFRINNIPVAGNLAAVGVDGAVQLSWSPSGAQGVTGYAVYRRTSGGARSLVSVVSSTATTWTDSGLMNCTTYSYSIATVVGSDTSALSNEVSATPHVPASVVVNSPAGGESWQVGTSKLIVWSLNGCSNNSDSVSIEYSTNGGSSWTAIATVLNTGSYQWTVANPPSNNAIVRITWNGVSGSSASAFAITPIAPPSGVTASAGNSRVTLNWTVSTAQGVSGYAIYRGTASGALVSIGQVDAATTSYVDAGLTNGTTYFYAIRTMVGSFTSAFSNEVSATPEMPSLTLISPNGGEVLTGGTVTTASWTSSGVVGTVAVEFSANNGASWTLLGTTANTGLYSWSVPNINTSTALLRISAADSVSDRSNAVFTINSTAVTAVNMKLMLQGPRSGDSMSTILSGENLLPVSQPYNVVPFSYNGSEQLTGSQAGLVDWLLLELRTGTSSATTVARRAVLLRADGQVVDANGYPEVLFPSGQVAPGSYYLVIRHRNHLDVMSASPVAIASGSSTQYNFTTSSAQAYNDFQTALVSVGGIWCMPAGDVAHNGIVDAGDRVAVRNASGQLGYQQADITMDGIVNAADRVMVRNNGLRVSQVP